MTYREQSIPIQKRVADLLGQMTLKEKIEQMGSCWFYELQTDGKLDLMKSTTRLQNGIGQITRVGSASTLIPSEIAKVTNKLQKILIEQTRLGIPAIFHEECCSGNLILGASAFPQMIGLACSFQPELAGKMADVIRRQLRAVGIHEGLSPVLDVARDPRWGRVEETFGEDPWLISQFGIQYVRGLQGDDLHTGAMATGKHFVGHSLSQGGLNCGPVQIGMRTLLEVYLMPFEAAIHEAHLASLMNSYPELDGEVVATSQAILRDVLRNRLGFEGLVVSDYESVSMLHTFHRVAENMTQAALKAIQAGIEVELPTNDCYTDVLIQEIEKGQLDVQLIDQAVAHHLSKKFELGLFDHPYVEEENLADLFDGPAQRELAAQMARQSLVLLTNDGTLPLAKSTRRLAVIGPNADDSRNLLCDYSYAAMLELQMYQRPANSAFTVLNPASLASQAVNVPTILQSIREKVPQTEVIYAKGCDVNSEDQFGIPAAVQAAGSADAVVLVLGDKSGLTPDCTCGETRDSSDLALPGVQMELARAVMTAGKPVVVVLVSGRPLAIPELAAKASAILEAWVPGEAGGAAVANALFGDCNPGGKLSMTFPHSVGQVPIFYNHKPSGAYSHWYTNYVNETTAPLFPFGHGLSYTQFSYRDLSIDKATATLGEALKIACTVQNTGSVAGEEVVQLYLQDEFASLPRPVKELKGFARVSLLPDQAKRVTFTLPVNLMAFYNATYNLVIEPGSVQVMIGSSSQDIRLQGVFSITGASSMVVEKREFTCPVRITDR